MQGDSASLIFDFDFDHEVRLIKNPHSQAHPSQQNTSLANLSHEKNSEKGSSSGSNLPASNPKQKLTASSTYGNNENVDDSNEVAPSLASPSEMPSTVIPQANENPTKESSEFQIQAGEKNNEAIGAQVNASNPENNHSQEGSSNQKLLASVAELSPSVTSPFNNPFSGAPKNSSFTTTNNENFGSSSYAFRSSISVEPVELGSTTGSNQPFLFNPSSSRNIAQRNLMGSTNLGFWATIDPSLLNNPKLSNSLGADYQLGQNVGNNTSFLQSSSRLGNANQQVPNWFSNQNIKFSPLTQSRPQTNQFLVPNVFDWQFANNSVSPRSSVPLRPRNLIGESNQLLPFAANAQETQGSINTMQPAVSVPFSLRSPQYSQLYQQLDNQVAVTEDLSNLQAANPLQLNNSLLSRTQVSSSDQEGLTLGHNRQMIPNIMDTQHDNSLFLRQSSLPSRAQNLEFQRLLNQPIRPTPIYPSPVSSLQDVFGGNNPLSSTPQFELSLNLNHELSFIGRRNRTSNRYDMGESSSSSSLSKRPKISNFSETGPTSQSRQNELENLLAANPFNNSRSNKNTLYDPIFESLGLPIDPHLRLFNSNH